MRLAYAIITASLQILYASCSSNDRQGASGRPSLFPGAQKIPRLGFPDDPLASLEFCDRHTARRQARTSVAIRVEDRFSLLRHHYRWE
jgi:hypothetical protein